MLHLISVTFKGIVRDRVFQGIMVAAVFFLVIPSISTLSMRQVAELSMTLSLSLFSFILLLLSIFLGGTALWKDIERKYTFSVLTLPISRTSYILSKFCGVAGFILLITILLGLIACVAIWCAAGAYPPQRPLLWTNIFLALFFTSLKYILLIAVAFLVSTVSTSFFLPLFVTISVFLAGSASQEVYNFLQSSSGQAYSPFIKKTATALYYILPNFSAFDLGVNAIYGLPLSYVGLMLTLGYFILYTATLLTLASIIFSRREMQ